MKLAGQRTADRIFQLQDSQDAFRGSFFKIQFGGPRVLRQELPFGQRNIPFDVAFHFSAASVPAHQGQLRGRIGQITFQEIREESVVASIFSAHEALKCGPRGRAGNPAFPFHASRNWFGSFPRSRGNIPDAINEILVCFQGLRFKLHVQQGISWREKALDGSVGRRRFELAGADK